MVASSSDTSGIESPISSVTLTMARSGARPASTLTSMRSSASGNCRDSFWSRFWMLFCSRMEGIKNPTPAAPRTRRWRMGPSKVVASGPP